MDFSLLEDDNVLIHRALFCQSPMLWLQSNVSFASLEEEQIWNHTKPSLKNSLK